MTSSCADLGYRCRAQDAVIDGVDFRERAPIGVFRRLSRLNTRHANDQHRLADVIHHQNRVRQEKGA